MADNSPPGAVNPPAGGSTSKQKILAAAPFFARLDDQAREELARRSQLRNVDAGKVVVREGVIGTELFVVVSGHLKIETEKKAGDTVLFDVVGPGDIFGELALLTGRPRAANVVAIGDCELVAIDYRDLRDLIERNSSVALSLLANLANRIIDFGDSVRAFAVAGLEPRLARRVCLLAKRQMVSGDETVTLDLHLTQREWAQMSGVSREAINRQFREWASRGWVEISEGEVKVLDFAALESLAGLSGLFSG